MKKHFKELMGYIAFGIIVFEYGVGLVLSYTKFGSIFMAIMTAWFVVCLLLLNKILEEPK